MAVRRKGEVTAPLNVERPRGGERLFFDCMDVDEDMVLITFNLRARSDEAVTNGHSTLAERLAKARKKRHRASARPTIGTRDQRASVRVEMRVKVEVADEQGRLLGRTENIGSGGVFVATTRELNVGERVKLQFTLPGRPRAVVVDAEVRWIRTSPAFHRPAEINGVGLRFVDPHRNVSAAIERFVRERPASARM